MAKQAQQQRPVSHLRASNQTWRPQIKPAAGFAGTSSDDEYDTNNNDDENHDDVF